MGTEANNWKLFFRSAEKRNELLLTVVILAVVLFSLTRFLNYVENRAGIVLYDPIHNLIPPVNLTWLIFGIIYISLIIALYFLVKTPGGLLFAMQCYTLMVIFRITAMYITPLNPPADMIPLADPFVEVFGTGRLMTKDLFFSGHTATLFILYLTADRKILKILFFCSTIIVAAAVIFQHVHYAVDVLVAPFFTYCSYVMVKKIMKH
ncbi:MAG: phosphatase PAP2-related protein [Ignavibacteriaceae bacterium]